MPRHANPFILHTLLGIVCLVAVLFLLPEGIVWWRKALACIFSIALGHQAAVAILAGTRSRVEAARAWLECLAFPLLIFATLKLPELLGWVLLVAGQLWKPLVGKLWK